MFTIVCFRPNLTMGYVVGKAIALILASAGIIHLVSSIYNYEFFVVDTKVRY